MFKVHRNYELTTGIKGTTIAVFVDDKFNVKVLYHNTIVFEKKGKVVTISTGGWDTVSTRHVINRALSLVDAPYRLERVKGLTRLNNISTNIGSFLLRDEMKIRIG